MALLSRILIAVTVTLSTLASAGAYLMPPEAKLWKPGQNLVEGVNRLRAKLRNAIGRDPTGKPPSTGLNLKHLTDLDRPSLSAALKSRFLRSG